MKKAFGNRKGFTIVELMVVIAIIAILAGAITVGVNGMFYKSRHARADALAQLLKNGLNTYYARNGEWPGPLKTLSQSSQEDKIVLSGSEADRCFREIVRVSTGPNANPVMDPSGLFVAQGIDEYGCTDIHANWNKALKLGIVSSGDHKCSGKCPRGWEFAEVTKKGSKNKISLSSMNFGYQGPNHGRFCRFRVSYIPKSDMIFVETQKATDREFIDD